MQISPVTRPKSAAQKAYDRMSGIYDLLAGSSETPLMRRGLELLRVGMGDAVLEIGCGTGKALAQVCTQVGVTGRVYGVDLSPGMLQQSYARLERLGMSNRVPLVEGDGAHLPFQSATISAVFISFTLELFDTPEIPLVLEECRRVLIPKGRLGVVSMLKTRPPNLIVRLYEWSHAHLPAYVDCRPIEAHRLLQEIGFNIHLREVKSMWGLPVEVVIATKA